MKLPLMIPPVQKKILTLFLAGIFCLPFRSLASESDLFKKEADFPIYAENIDFSVSGTVTDPKGEPLIGVNVVVKGTPRGTSTDLDGKFILDGINQGDILVFSYVGYISREVSIEREGDINVILEQDSEILDEVVVVAYGKQKKESVTGSLAAIGTREIKQSPAANLAVGLAGKLPGLTSIQRSGEPGLYTNELYIRGVSSPNSTAPLILVDGIERNLEYIDPNEVEDITILKDASSTALYGVRGANGVILVTTRRGEDRKPEINFTSELSAQNFTRFPQTVNAYEYATLKNLALQNDGLPYQFSAEEIEKYRSGSDPVRYPDTDWKDILLKDFALQQRYNLNVSGGGKNVRYFVNAGYLRDGGQFKVEKGLPYDPSFRMDRYNFRSNIDIDLNSSLRAFLNLAGYLEKRNLPSAINSISPYDILTRSPSYYIVALTQDMNATIPGPVVPPGYGEASGEVSTGSGVDWPPYGMINRSGFYNVDKTNITATYGMEQKLDFLTKGLSAKAVVSFDTQAANALRQVKSFPLYVQVIDHNLKGADGQDSISYKKFDSRTNTPLSDFHFENYTSRSEVEIFLDYNRQFGHHEITGLLLFQKRKEIIDGQLPFNHLGTAARFSYGYDNRYFLEFNGGYNGSEQFTPGRRFGFFPAISGAWIVSNENFLKDHHFLTKLKLRGSYGKVGNDGIGGRRFLYLDNISISSGGYSPSLAGLGGSPSQVNINLLGNPNVQWEVAQKSNLGVEIGLLNNLDLEVDVFHEKRDNILITPNSIPSLIGISSGALPPINAGIIKNRGYEIQLNYQKMFNRNWSLLSRLNFNHARDEVVYGDEPLLPEEYAYRYRATGYPLGQNWGYIVEGYFRDEAEIIESPVQEVGGHATRPGDFKYKDLNNDGVIDEKDVAPLGYPKVPFYTYGAAFRIARKNVDVSLLIQGVFNVSTFLNDRYAFPTDRNFLKWHLDGWTEEKVINGDPIRYPRISTQPSPNEIANSFFNVNTSYVRLKSAELGYTIPGDFLKKLGAEEIRVYLNGFNLLTWDRLPTKDVDPEKVSDLSGVGPHSYPLTRMFNFGINIKF